MGLVKFEVEIPNFEKELSINITIRRDGEVFYNSTSSPSMENINNKTLDNDSEFSLDKVVNSAFNIGEGMNKATNEEPKKKKKSEKLETNTAMQSEEVPVIKKRGNFMNAEL